MLHGVKIVVVKKCEFNEIQRAALVCTPQEKTKQKSEQIVDLGTMRRHADIIASVPAFDDSLGR
jgi:hypothetical protein